MTWLLKYLFLDKKKKKTLKHILHKRKFKKNKKVECVNKTKQNYSPKNCENLKSLKND